MTPHAPDHQAYPSFRPSGFIHGSVVFVYLVYEDTASNDVSNVHPTTQLTSMTQKSIVRGTGSDPCRESQVRRSRPQTTERRGESNITFQNLSTTSNRTTITTLLLRLRALFFTSQQRVLLSATILLPPLSNHIKHLPSPLFTRR